MKNEILFFSEKKLGRKEMGRNDIIMTGLREMGCKCG
jgi:hypothetical protein